MKFYSTMALVLGIASIANAEVMAATPGMGVAGILSFIGKTGHDMAITRYYANEVLNTAAILAITATSANGGEGKDITLTEFNKEFNPSFDLCNIDMNGYKNGVVKIMFGENCQTRKGETMSMREIQEQVQKLSGDRATCSGQECLISFNKSVRNTSSATAPRDTELLAATASIAVAAEQSRSSSSKPDKHELARTYANTLLDKGKELATMAKNDHRDLNYRWNNEPSVGFVEVTEPEPCQADFHVTQKGVATLTLTECKYPVTFGDVCRQIERLGNETTYCENNICQIDYSKRK